MSTPKITLIAAMANDRVIGINNTLPWDLPADLQHFKAQTMGKPILMGRKTYDSIGRPLPGRHNIVVSRNDDLQIEGCTVVSSVETALEAAGAVEEVMVMGGASFYEQLLPRANRLVLTLIDLEVEGDAWFPALEANEWKEVSREEHEPDEKNRYPYSFMAFERIA